MSRLTVPPLTLPLALAVVLSATLGCGAASDRKAEGERTVVTGKLVENGKPFALDQSKIPLPKGARSLPPGVTGALSVIFTSSETKEQFRADVNSDAGTFQVKGPEGKGIPAGRYRIAVTGRLGIGSDTPDYFGGKYTPEKTQILRDIKPGSDIEIDVAKPQG